MSDQLWDALCKRAQRDGITASFAVATLARDFANRLLDVDETTGSSDPTRSTRISDEVWDALKLRAEAQRQPATRVLAALAARYVAGQVAIHVHIVTSQIDSR